MNFLFDPNDKSAWHQVASFAVELMELPFLSSEQKVSSITKINGVLSPIFEKTFENYDIIRRDIACLMQEQVLAFSKSAFVISDHFKITEFEEVLFALYESLCFHPTSFEYHGLRSLPHDRDVLSAEFKTLGDFWFAHNFREPGAGIKITSSEIKKLISLGIYSVRDAGIAITMKRVNRWIRRQIYNKI